MTELRALLTAVVRSDCMSFTPHQARLLVGKWLVNDPNSAGLWWNDSSGAWAVYKTGKDKLLNKVRQVHGDEEIERVLLELQR